MKHGPELGFDDDGRPVLITAAAPSYEQQHRDRVRKYLTLMAFRVPALLLAAVAYGLWHNGLISLLILVASIPLPWIAVLIANDRPPRTAEEPRRYDAAPTRTPLFPTATRPALERPKPPPSSLAEPPGSRGGPSFASPPSSLAEPPGSRGGPSFASPPSSLAEPPESGGSGAGRAPHGTGS